MESDGTYQKGRKRITKSVTRVPPEKVPEPALLEEVGVAVKRLDKDRLVLRKSTGWAIAAAVIVVLGAMAFIGTRYFTREHQLDHLREEVRELTQDLELTRTRQRVLQRRLVELETKLENVEERR